MVNDLKKFAVKTEPGRLVLVEWEQIFYIEAERADTIVRTARKRARRHLEPLHEVEPRLPSPPFLPHPPLVPGESGPGL